MRARWLLAGLVAVAALLWSQSAAYADPPGNNGTIKIHDPQEKEPVEMDNEPHPGCVFHIHGFNFDANSSGTWDIDSWPPTGDKTQVMSGTWTANANGEWRTADISTLKSGHYKAFAKQTKPTTPGDDKHKVFWVKCETKAAAPGQNAPAANAPAPPGQNAPAANAPGANAPANAPQNVLGQQSAPNVGALPNTSTADQLGLIAALMAVVGLGVAVALARHA